MGKKTAAIVLLFSCGVPVFPVDTHVYRLSKRLGMVPAKKNADNAHDIMDALVADNAKYRFHINMIEHGRIICHPRKPECGSCCLNAKCGSAFKIQ